MTASSPNRGDSPTAPTPPVKRRTYEILEVARPGDRASRVCDIFLISLICTNIAALVLSSVESIYRVFPEAFYIFEAVSVGIFTVEYILRVWSYTEEPRYAHPLYGRIKFVLSPIQLMDLLAILPFFLVFLGVDLRPLRAVRLLARAIRLSRYFAGLRTLGSVLQSKRYEMFMVLLVLGVLLVLASCLMYFAEKEVQPDAFASIPAAMWWTIVTLTTVGYGDVFPITSLGRVLAGFIAILGIGFFALPAGILGSGFLEEVQRREEGPRVCPHCGLEIVDQPPA